MTTDDADTLLLEPPPVVTRPAAAVRHSSTRPATAIEPEWLRRGQIPALDGLRGVAVLLVVMTHSFQTRGFPEGSLRQLYHYSVIGVDIFFVISGFLITTLLLRELDRNGEIQLRRFYLRRMLRIMPAFWGLMAVVAVGQALGLCHLTATDWISAATYTTNFFHHPSWELGHSWSLAIEEHFYLIWPFVLYAGGVTWGRRVGVACLAICEAIRCGIAFGIPPLIFPTGSSWADVGWCSQMSETWTFTRMDTITVGSLLAIAARSAQWRIGLDRATRPVFLFVYCGLLCGSLYLTRSAKFTLCISYLLNAVCIALLMWGAIRSTGMIRKVISNRLLRIVGLGSYSIYLWQQLFLNPQRQDWFHSFPQNVVFALMAAACSYWLIEQPMNRWKDRIAA